MRLGFAKEKWKNMSDIERAPFMELSSLERQRFSANQSRLGVYQIQTFLEKKRIKRGKSVIEKEAVLFYLRI